jgi:hypothetical protein
MKFVARSILACSIIIVLGCTKENSSPELEKHFNKNQIEDLNKINNFFISELLNSEKGNYKKSFLQFKDFLKFNGRFSDNDELLFKKQLKLYNSISQSTFDEIWKLRTTEGPPYPDEDYIAARNFGKYFSFLNEISTENKFAKTCFEKIERSGDYNALFLDSYFYYNLDTFDFNNFHNQLILSIYYLTAIDNYERDFKRKRRFEEQLKKMNLEFEQRQK